VHDPRSLGRVEQRLVLVVPVDAEMDVLPDAENVDDPAALRGSAG